MKKAKIPLRVWLCLLGVVLAGAGTARPIAAAENTNASSRQDDGVQPRVVFEALCKALRDNYPMLEYAGLVGDRWVEDYGARVQAASTREAAFEVMDEFVCSLNDKFSSVGARPHV
jgi:hypothetical protein